MKGSTQLIKKNRNNTTIKTKKFIIRVVHVVPVHPDAHEQVFGLVHVPPLEHAGEHTADKKEQK